MQIKNNVLEERKEKYTDGDMVVLLCTHPSLTIIFKTVFIPTSTEGKPEPTEKQSKQVSRLFPLQIILQINSAYITALFKRQ